MAKKCENYNGCPYAGRPNPRHNEHYYCPEDIGPKCEIVAKKPKMVKVKGWADVGGKQYNYRIFGAFPEKGFVCDKKGPLKSGYKPCFILIDEKYLRGEK